MNLVPVRIRLLCLLVAIFAFGSAPRSGDAGPAKKIGIFAFSREARYENAGKGIRDQLRQDGYDEPGTQFVTANADANKAKAAEIVQRIRSEKFDLIFTLGTNMTIPIAREIKNVPIVFSEVYDPVASGIAQSWASSGNNTTGVSSHVPMNRLVETLLLFSRAKKLAVLYAPNEKNAELQLRELLEIEKTHVIDIVPMPVSSKEDIARALPVITKTVDAIFVTGSNLIGSNISEIAATATKAGIVTISHLDDLVDGGVLLGFAPNSYEDGRLAGVKAVQVLKGTKPSAIPIEPLKKNDILLNGKTAKAGKFTVPPDFMKKVTRTIE
jgi:putative ABC transport system substrate-binding protein